jgi:hypothetical protein
MTRWLLGAVGVAVTVAAVAPRAEAKDDRRAFDLKKMKALRFEVASTSELAGLGLDLKVVVMTQPLDNEAAAKKLGPVTRMFVLQGEQVVFDSFAWDEVSEAVEPGPTTRTFFDLKWSVVKPVKTAKTGFLVLTGAVPQQDPGEAIRTASRVLVMTYRAESGFEEVLDAISARPAVVTGTEVRIPIQP